MELVMSLRMKVVYLDNVWCILHEVSDVDVILDPGVIDDAGVRLRHGLRLECSRADQDCGELEGVDAVVDVSGHVSRVAEGVLGGGCGRVTLEHHPGAPLLAVVPPAVAHAAPAVLDHDVPTLIHLGSRLCRAQTLKPYVVKKDQHKSFSS